MTAVGPRTLLLCGLLLCSSVAIAGIAGAAPPPRPLCDACGDQFEETAQTHGVTLDVERSAATVSVHSNGSATWDVRNHLASDGEELRRNDSRRRAIADRAMWDTELLNASVSSDGVVVLRYREPDFAEPAVGDTLRSGAFTEAYGYRNIDGLGADRLTVVAPPEKRIGRTLPASTVTSDGNRLHLTSFERGGVLTFVPQDTTIGPVLSGLAVATLLGPTVAANVLIQVLIPTTLFGLLVAAVGGGLTRFHSRLRNRSGGWHRWLAGAGLLLASLAFGLGSVSLLGGPTVLLIGVGVGYVTVAAALSRPAVTTAASYSALIGVALVAGLVATLASLASATVLGQNAITRSFLTTAWFLVPLFALLPAGYAFGTRRRRLAVATAVGGLLLALLPTVPLLTPRVGFGAVVMLFVAAVTAVVLLLGVALFATGFGIGLTHSTSRPSSDVRERET